MAKGKKRYPVQRNFTVRQANANASGIVMVDRSLSRLNHRLYRQGRYYEMKLDVDVTSTLANPIEVYVLRDTWANQKAFQMAFANYQEATALERSRLSKDQLARWSDFRTRHGTGFSELLPVVADESGAETTINTGEFYDSKVETAGGAEKRYSWKTEANSFNLLSEYNLKGNTDDDPATVSTDTPYSDMDSDLSNIETDDLTNFGNQPPYSQVTFADPWVKIATLRDEPGKQRLSTGYFTAPCGFVVVTNLTGEGNAPTNLHVTVKGGDYKGVSAHSMLE